MRKLLLALSGTSALLMVSLVSAEQLEIPRRHDRPPGPPVSAIEAAAKMTVPQGFAVEVVAAEPDIMNPVAMFIDERGRFWVTESFEYPRKEPGPGRDRIKVLDDTDGDGAVDKVTVFAEGLNIPSGIAVGHGGVWVANSPDLLFLQDTDGDLKADRKEVVVTGFGRTDTHELPNSLTWGPDGWLYGLNGVFNLSHVRYAPGNPNYEKDHPGWKFTCALFRVHPQTREFELFAEGTSNPWGVAINDAGDFFLSACVIDHLWHLTESGYYIRQGGPYPPHTWPVDSIVEHTHQKAAYCGIHWFDSEAYPEAYRNVLYMGNIHGGCINADVLERDGATYQGKPHPGFPAKPGAWDEDEYGVIAKAGPTDQPRLADFLTANDAWFMPVAQKTGPDGCLYILDWYDRYHCYQDANADPAGVDRGKGRLYRVVYQGHQNQAADDLSRKSDDDLIGLLLQGSNEYERATARRLLSERLRSNAVQETVNTLTGTLKNKQATTRVRLQAMWTLASAGQFPSESAVELVSGTDSTLARWAIRLATDKTTTPDPRRVEEVVADISSLPVDVALQVLITSSRQARRREQQEVDKAVFDRILNPVAKYGSQPLVMQIGWENLKDFLVASPGAFVASLQSVAEQDQLQHVSPLVSRSVALLCDQKSNMAAALHDILRLVGKSSRTALKSDCLDILNDRARNGSLSQDDIRAVRPFVAAARHEQELSLAAMTLEALWGEDSAAQGLRTIAANTDESSARRRAAVQTLVAISDPAAIDVAREIVSAQGDASLRMTVIDSLSRLNDPRVADLLLKNFDSLEPDIQPRAIEVLTQRPAWGMKLLREVQAEHIAKSQLNFNQLRRMATFRDEAFQKQLAEVFGQIRDRNRGDRQNVINGHRDFLRGTPGDPEQGALLFKKVCAQCHKIYGEGAEVGPDITRNGRNNWEQLLQNVFDPSAVIGPGYQARLLATADGRVLTGLPVEESDERVILKIQGGKLETIPREQIEAYKVSELSMMPENIEKLMTPQELADLFAYLALDRPPADPNAKLLPGAPEPKRRK